MSSLFGLTGAALAVPAAAMFKIAIEEFYLQQRQLNEDQIAAQAKQIIYARANDTTIRGSESARAFLEDCRSAAKSIFIGLKTTLAPHAVQLPFNRFRTPVKPFAQVTLLSKVADQDGQRVSERSIAGYSNAYVRVRSSGPHPQFILSKT